MNSNAETVDEYLLELSLDRREVLTKLRNIILKNLPEGFHEEMNYGMIGYVVPHSIYPDGYHCDPELPLPFINIASQKNHVAFYYMGMYADSELLDWFIGEYPKYSSSKLDMGKCCVRFKKLDDIPYELIGQVVSKMTVRDWINIYENNIKKKKGK